MTGKGRDWSGEADDLLEATIEEFTDDAGRTDWVEVEKVFPSRTLTACRGRWFRIQEKLKEKTGGLKEDPPTHHQLFVFMRDNPRTLEEIANRFDRSPKHIERKIAKMEETGYTLHRHKQVISVETHSRPKGFAPEINLADMAGQEFEIGFASDLHAASTHCQPTSHSTFVNYCYDRGIRHIFNPGDSFTGFYGYRGQREDVLPNYWPVSRPLAHMAVDNQVLLANSYYPELPGLIYYNLGGNHDYWHVSNTGLDGVRLLCEMRDDMVYLGYDVGSVPLTNKTHIRLWHPSGGVPYALSYRIQKAMEQQSFEALHEAIQAEKSAVVSILAAGHMHVTVFVPQPPMYGLHVGCFEGKTNYLKKKGLTPHLGGVILRIKIKSNERIGEVSYTFVDFPEERNQWEEWDQPTLADVGDKFVPEQVENLLSFGGDAPAAQ